MIRQPAATLKSSLMTLVGATVLIFTFAASNTSAQTCADFKNRTYTAFGETVFDNAPSDRTKKGVFAFRWTFDATGQGRQMRQLDTTDTGKDSKGAYNNGNYVSAARQTWYTFKCDPTNMPGVFLLHLTVENTQLDGGYYYFKSFENGKRLWVKHTIAGRDTPFWAFEVPSAPIGEQFPKTN